MTIFHQSSGKIRKKQKEIQNFRNGLKNFTTTPMTSLENKKKQERYDDGKGQKTFLKNHSCVCC